MSFQRGLEDYDASYPDEENPMDMGKVVRNINYHRLQNDLERLGRTCGMVYQALYENPNGLTDKEIVAITRLPLASVNGRRNDLKKYGYAIVSVDVREEVDHNGWVHTNNVWGLIR